MTGKKSCYRKNASSMEERGNKNSEKLMVKGQISMLIADPQSSC